VIGGKESDKSNDKHTSKIVAKKAVSTTRTNKQYDVIGGKEERGRAAPDKIENDYDVIGGNEAYK